MSAHASADTRAPLPELWPERALLHPLWLIALALLALNDHVLKGAGLLPGVITGKLSDVAGLIVAPVALAALLRTRSRRGLIACCVATGAVFAAIQVSAAAALVWGDFTGLLGFPWATVSDAADLLALPTLVVPAVVLVPSMRRPVSVRPVLRLARQSTLVGAVLACLASSPPPETATPFPEDEACEDDQGNFGRCDATLCWNTYNEAVYCDRVNCSTYEWQDTASCSGEYGEGTEGSCLARGGEWVNGACAPACFGQRNSAQECVFPHADVSLFLYNDTAETALVRVLALDPSVKLDCPAVAAAPSRLLKRPLFVAAGSWVLDPGQVRPLEIGLPVQSCSAIVLGSGTSADHVVFWTPTTTTAVWDEPSADHLASTQGVALTGTLQAPEITPLSSTIQVVRLTPPARPAEGDGMCAAQPAGQRLAWSDGLPYGQPLRIDAIVEGDDGCLGVTLTPAADEWASPERWYACLGTARFPFDAGDVVERPPFYHAGVFSMNRLEPAAEADATEDVPPSLAMHLVRQPSVAYVDTFGIALSVEPANEDCPAQADVDCGTVSQPAAVVVSEPETSQTDRLEPGESVVFLHPDGSARTVDVIRAELRPVVNAACSDGSDERGADVELMIVNYAEADPFDQEETP